MLEIVEKVHFATSSLGCKDVLALWHVSGFVNLTLVVNLDIEAYTRLLGATNSVTRLALLVQGIVAVFFGVF